MKLNFLGGAMEVGGSSILLEIDDKKILLDAGIRQSANKDKLPNYKTIQDKGGLDYIIISHAHMDHIGTLPIISKAYPNTPIYMTSMTKQLTRVLLYDSLKIMEQEDDIPHYAEEDVINMLDRIVPIAYNTPYTLCPPYMKFQFYPAGHIAGAGLIHIMANEGSVLYTGDYSGFSQRTIEGAYIPKIQADVLITETTYGTTLHSNRQVEEQKIVDIAKNCIENKGKMLIPVFALGRAQEVLLILKSAINKGLIPPTKIYVDGLVRKINSVYTGNPLFLKNSLGKQLLKGFNPFNEEYIYEVKNTDSRDDFFKDDEPAIFVASSGMLSGGASVYYAKKIVSDSNGYIVITGYQDEDAPGRTIVKLLNSTEKNPKMIIDGVSYPVKCHLEKAGLSAHADKDEISGLVQKIMPSHLFLVHGDSDTIKTFSNELQQSFYKNIWLPTCGEECEIVLKSTRRNRTPLPKFKMDMVQALSLDNIKQLWEFIVDNYGNTALFTAGQIYYIWYGKRTVSENKIKIVQDILLNSSWFEPNPRRLFQFRPCIIDDVEKVLNKEVTPQELEKIVHEDFADYPIKKISFHQNTKEIVLVFDFPNTLNRNIQEIYKNFEDKTGWKVSNNVNINTTATGNILRELFGERLYKTSYFLEDKAVSIKLKNSDKDTPLIEKFKSITGLNLNISYEDVPKTNDVSNKSNNISIVSENTSKLMEQNKALSIVDSLFFNSDIKPYKKGLKQDNYGKYIELSFLTPKLAERCIDTIENIHNTTGWNIKVSKNINQIEVFSVVNSLCNQLGIQLVKTPSYLPTEYCISIKISSGEEHFNELKNLVMDKLAINIKCTK